MMETLNTPFGPYVLLTGPSGKWLPGAREAFRRATSETADFLYADEILATSKGPKKLFKPDWSPDTVLSWPYTGFPVAMRRTLYDVCRAEGGEQAESAAFQLRALQRAREALHIPRFLMTGGSVPSELPGETAKVLRETTDASSVLPGLFPGSMQVRYPLPSNARLTVLVWGIERAEPLRKTLEALELRSTGARPELLLPVPQRADKKLLAYLRELAANGAARLIEPEGDETPLACTLNRCVEEATGNVLLLLRAGVELQTHDGLERLAEQALRLDIGTVGAKILTPDRRILHCGYFLGLTDRPETLYRGQKDSMRFPLQNRYVNCTRNVTAVGEGVLAVRRSVFLECGGFDRTLPTDVYEAELGVRLSRAHKRNVYQPYAVFVNTSPQKKEPLSAREKTRMSDLMFPFRRAGDPMLSTNPEIVARYQNQLVKS